MSVCIVSGATSFLGRHLVSRLLCEQHMVYAIVRPNSKNLDILPVHPNCKVILADVGQTQTWNTAIGYADSFFHLAWDGIGMEGRANQAVQKQNVQNSLACLRAASELGVKRFFFFGSQAEYGQQTAPVDESSPCVPVSEYGKAKLRFGQAAQPLAQSLGIGYTHLRIFSVYGPGDHPWTLVNSCVKAFLEGEKIELSSCEQPWNFLYAQDFARAVTALSNGLEKNCGIVNIAGDETQPLKKYVDTIWRLCGSKGIPLYGAVGSRLERPYGIMPVNKKLHQMTSWRQQIPFEVGIREMLKIEHEGGVE